MYVQLHPLPHIGQETSRALFFSLFPFFLFFFESTFEFQWSEDIA